MRKPSMVFTVIFILIVTLLLPSAKPVNAETWSTQLHQLTDHPTFDGFPAITQRANGTIDLVWTRSVMTNLKLYHTSSANGGTTWSTESNLTDIYDTYQDTNPSILQALNGTIWVVWASNRPPPSPPLGPDFSIDAIPSNLTIPRGESDNSTIIITSLRDFNEPVDLMAVNEPANVTTTLDPDSVTPPSNGTANANLTVTVGPEALVGNYSLYVLGRSGKKSHTVEIELEITNSTMLGYNLSSPHVSSTEKEESSGNYRVYYKTSHDSGVTWSDNTPLEPASSSDDQNPFIIQTLDGTIWIAWQTHRTGDYEIFYKTSSDGTSWSDAHNVTSNPSSDKSPSLTQTSDGTVWVAWSSDRTGQYEIFSKTYDGAVWSAATPRTSTATYIDSTPSILTTFNGTIWLFWSSSEDKVSATADLFYQKSINGGLDWSSQTQFTVDANDDFWPSTLQTRDTKVWAVWTKNSTGNMELFCQTSMPGDLTGPENPLSSGQYPPDGFVDAYDLAFIGDAYGKQEGTPDWDVYMFADVTGPEDPPATRRYPPDGTVDIYDLVVVGKDFGRS